MQQIYYFNYPSNTFIYDYSWLCHKISGRSVMPGLIRHPKTLFKSKMLDSGLAGTPDPAPGRDDD